MECDICARHGSARRGFHCPTCSRSTLYPLRIDLVKALAEKEDAARRVEAVVKGEIPPNLPNSVLDGVIVDIRDCARATHYSTIKDDTVLTRDRVEAISLKANELRRDIEEYKAQMKDMKATIAKKKSDMESAAFGLDSRSSSEIDTVQKAARRTARRWETSHKEVIRGRMSLCREASKLAGLRKIKTVEGQSMKEHFEIAHHLMIYDLRSMAKADPAVLSATLTSIAFLVSRVSTYLALQLPAEVVLPSNFDPLPTIYMPSSSYANREPAILDPPSHSGTPSPMASKTFSIRPRPRTLTINRPLIKLAKEDPTAFSMFVEGATLLAWDIAWICKSQGMQGLNSWTDICDMGRNLYELLMADHRAASRPSKKGDEGKDSRSEAEPKHANNLPMAFGQFSHGTANSFLGMHDNSALVRSWRLGTPQRVIDRVKQTLMTEMTGAEWEVLQEMEWSHQDDEEEPVLVRGRRTSTAAAAAASGNLSDAKSRKSGTSGWTKLRSRAEGNGAASNGNMTGNEEP
jgi:Vacuolar sorting 38 and autophagy-related subunit 14